MRSTKASAAVERLRARSGNPDYTMSSGSDGLFALRLTLGKGLPEMVGVPLPMLFVNGIAAAAPKRVSKLDVAFRTQLKGK